MNGKFAFGTALVKVDWIVTVSKCLSFENGMLDSGTWTEG